MNDGVPSERDPIVVRRAQVAAWCAAAKRVGYGMVGLAIVAFAVGAATTFNGVVVGFVVAALALSAATLIPAVIFGYGVAMAEREERGEPFRH